MSIFAITILGHGIENLLRKPTVEGVAFILFWAILTVVIFVAMRKWFARYAQDDTELVADEQESA